MVWQHAAEPSARLVGRRNLASSLFVFLWLLIAVASLRTAQPAQAAPTPAPTAYDLQAGVTGSVTGRAGQVVSVAVSWRNAGPAAVRGVRAVYTPPLGTAVATPLPAGWVLSGRTAVQNQTGSVAAGTARSAAIRVRIPATAVAGSLLVGGGIDVTGGAGTDSRPANNHATNRISVLAPAATPSASAKATPKASPKVSAKASPKPSAVLSPSSSPKAASAAPTVRPTAAPAGPTPAATRRAPVREPKLTPSTFVITAPAPSGPPIVDVVPVVGDGLFSGIELVPLAGAIACFTAAGTGTVMVRRRRAAERAHQAEIRSVELANEPRQRSAQRV